MDRKIEQWTKENEKFVETRSSENCKTRLKDCNFLVVIGNPGTGKSALIRHLALDLMRNEEFVILPVHSPDKIVDYTNASVKQVFVIDDVCGKCSLSIGLLESWKRYEEELTDILRSSHTHVVVTCRTDIFKCPQLQRVKLLTSNVCDLCSPELSLVDHERTKIAINYLNADDVPTVLDPSISKLYDFFPLLCKLYSENDCQDVRAFFTRPVSMIEDSLAAMQVAENKAPFCALALLVLFNDSIEDEWLTGTLSVQDKILLELVYEECEMNTFPSRKTIKRELDKLHGMFVKFEDCCYKSLHDKVFDIMAGFIGRELFDLVLRNADIKFISERYVFQGTCNAEDYLIQVPSSKEGMFFTRLFEDYRKAFESRQLANASFRQKFICYCRENEHTVKSKLNQIDRASEFSPLVHSVTFGYEDLVAMMLEFNVTVEIRDGIGRSGVAIAVETDNPRILSMLLSAKADVDAGDMKAHTPLCVAAGLGREECCKILLENGADANKRSIEGMFPLYWACMNENLNIINLLLDNGADINLRNTNGWTSLHFACRRNNSNIVKVLLDANADPNIRPSNYVISTLFEAVSRGNLEIVKLLISYGAEFKNKLDETHCLNEAVEKNYIDIVKFLIEKGADASSHDADDNFPLLISAASGNVAITKLLLEYGCDVNDCSRGIHTPLSVASYLGRFDVVQFLLENKADVTCANSNGDTALHLSTRCNDHRIPKLLLDHKADPNTCNYLGNSCVSDAAFYNKVETLRLFVENGGYLNTKNNVAETPLFRSARAGNLESVELLLQNNADPDIPDNNGNTPLSEASRNGFSEIVMLLLAYDASVNLINVDGSGALHLASEAGLNDIVTMLLNQGANPFIYNNAGLTAKDVAQLCGFQDVYETIEYRENLIF